MSLPILVDDALRGNKVYYEGSVDQSRYGSRLHRSDTVEGQPERLWFV